MLAHRPSSKLHSHTQYYHGGTQLHKRAPRTLQWGHGGADPEAMYNLCLILETMLQKLYHAYNRNKTPFSAANIYI